LENFDDDTPRPLTLNNQKELPHYDSDGPLDGTNGEDFGLNQTPRSVATEVNKGRKKA
jgi:hypothetical protein